jgi:hypothetical protein
MHTKIIVLMTVLAHAANAQRAEDIEAEFNTKALTACEKLDTTLKREGTTVAASLAAVGDSAGAETVSQQVESAIKGESITKPHVKMAKLLTQYDAARTAILKPIREACIDRLDRLLKTSAGKDMSEVVKIAKIRQGIMNARAAALVAPTPAHAAPTAVSGTGFPLEWGYFSHPNMDVQNGRMVFKEDGTFILHGPQGTTAATPGTWTATGRRNVLTAELKGGEKGTITIKGGTAVYERDRVGTRYLKVIQP